MRRFSARFIAGLIILPSLSVADLYISPTARDGLHSAPSLSREHAIYQEQMRSQKVVNGYHGVEGEFLIQQYNDENALVMRYGKSVPLFIALDKVVPNASQWKINIDEGLADRKVSWDGGRTWKDVVDLIASANDLNIIVNQDEMAIGVAMNQEIAQHLARKSPQVWRLNPKKTFRGNLESWASTAGWKVEYANEIYTVDYDGMPAVTLTGVLTEPSGPIDTLLNDLNASANVKLAAEFYTKSKTILIKRLAHQKDY